jgi:hypothetical protein
MKYFSRGVMNQDLRDLSCLLRCSLLLNALLQNWHLYLRSGAMVGFRTPPEAAGLTVIFATAAGIVATIRVDK